MKIKLLLCVLLLATVCLKAQVVITLQLPPLGLTIKPQLWNLSVVNSTGATMNAQWQMVMTDVGTNQTVLTAQSTIVPLPAGLKLVTAGNVGPLTYTAGAGYSIEPGPNGFLPVGVFNVCFTLTKWTNDISEQLAEECVTVEVEPIGPPQLMQPGDSDRVDLKRPFFTWLPPTPVAQFRNLQYDWLLVEVQATQSASDAIQQNIPLLTQPNLSFTSLQYPLSMPELDTGKLYAWRITAKSNSMVVANSEIWSFRIQPYFNEPVIKRKGYYSPLRRQRDASFIICDGLLLFKYENTVNNAAVQLSITDLSDIHQKQLPLDSSDMKVQYGANYLELDLAAQGGFTERHMYLLELVNDQKERWYLKFEYRSKK